MPCFCAVAALAVLAAVQVESLLKRAVREVLSQESSIARKLGWVSTMCFQQQVRFSFVHDVGMCRSR